MATQNITIHWTGGTAQPTAIPANPSINPGTTTIIWSIASTAPSGTVFPATNGIQFVPNGSAPAVWPGSQPTIQPDGTYQVTDSNKLVSGQQRVKYNYSVTVQSGGGTLHNTPDPDLTNSPPP
jgi:hypothetical protein